MGIPPTRYRSYPHEFSGGMRQRLMIALALVLRPAFVVADEPTTALDVLVEAQIVQILNDLRRNFDTALLLITHNLGIVAEACDRVAVMYAGRIVEQGASRDVFGNPQHPYTRELLRSTISLSTTGLNFIPGAPPDLVDPPARLPVPPAVPGRDEGLRGARTRSTSTRAGGGRVECWLHGPDELIPAGGPQPLEQEEIDRCRRSLRPRPTDDTVIDIHDLSVHFDLGGSTLARLLGRDTGTVKAVDGVNLDAPARRGRRPGRRERQRQVDARPGAARPGPGHVGLRRIRFEGRRGHRDAAPRAARAPRARPDGLPGPERRAQPGHDRRAGASGDPLRIHKVPSRRPSGAAESSTRSSGSGCRRSSCSWRSTRATCPAARSSAS